ncbi:MAG: Nramp family divalent metal transporter [Bacteroidota bacterium]
MAQQKKTFPLSTGLLVAATGVGAGDLVLSALGGARYGLVLLWAIPIGAVLKYALNEGLAKWELATGTTLLEGWVEKLPRAIPLYFGVYLVFWSFLVAGTLISYTGLAANTILPLPFAERWGTFVWGAAQSLLTVGLIRSGGFRAVERLMRVFVGLMFLVVIGSAVAVAPDWGAVLRGVFVPGGISNSEALLFVFALIGGVGGTLTIMCYSYWLREQRSIGAIKLAEVRKDLGVAYALTAIFGMAVLVIAAGVQPDEVKGYGLVLSISDRLGEVLGSFGRWAFLLGFWAAVFTSLVGVWNGVPYLFTDFIRRYQARYAGAVAESKISDSAWYRGYLWYLAVPPLLLLVFKRPDWIGVAYAWSGAFFMPFLAVLILYLNNQSTLMGQYRNRWGSNLLLVLCLLLFLVLFGVKFIGVF